MRIIGGAYRGRVLRAPAHRGTRPTSDRTREALFSILTAWQADFWQGRRVLDIFAGSGALGLEALSRGAAFSVFIETDAAARGAIRDNIAALALDGQSKIYRRDARHLGARPSNLGAAFDLVFMDPPYDKGLVTPVLADLVAGQWLAPAAVVIIEESRRATFEVPPQLVCNDQRLYGDTQISILTLT
jgi:16S rRNA (guanine966-N2)-methyltransferase